MKSVPNPAESLSSTLMPDSFAAAKALLHASRLLAQRCVWASRDERFETLAMRLRGRNSLSPKQYLASMDTIRTELTTLLDKYDRTLPFETGAFGIPSVHEHIMVASAGLNKTYQVGQFSAPTAHRAARWAVLTALESCPAWRLRPSSSTPAIVETATHNAKRLLKRLATCRIDHRGLHASIDIEYGMALKRLEATKQQQPPVDDRWRGTAWIRGATQGGIDPSAVQMMVKRGTLKSVKRRGRGKMKELLIDIHELAELKSDYKGMLLDGLSEAVTFPARKPKKRATTANPGQQEPTRANTLRNPPS